MRQAYICDYTRTPFGRYGGVLSSVRADDLAAIPLSYFLKKYPKLSWDELDDVILGCANQAGEDNRNVARMAVLLANLPISVPGTTVNRLCGSGLNAIAMAAMAIRSGDADLMIAGGIESMSRAPYVMSKANSAFSRAQKVHDTTIGWRFVNSKMASIYGVDSMPETGENVAERYQISRKDQDQFAYRSQQKTAHAQRDKRFVEEITPVTLNNKKGKTIIIDKDEHPRNDTTLEKLASLPTPFRQNGTVTAGNASGVNDGAAALIIASDEAIKTNNLSPIARITGFVAVGVEPNIMGYGPAPAIQKLLNRHNWKISDLDLLELNEAFASQALAVLRDIGLPDDSDIVNPNGGAIALGHPLGASGARITGTAALELKRNNHKKAMASMCVGVGQGVALTLEAV